MSISLARLAKQRYDAKTVAVTECASCNASFDSKCRRHGREAATPCASRQDQGDELRLWLYLFADVLTPKTPGDTAG